MHAIKTMRQSITPRAKITLKSWADARGSKCIGVGNRSPVMQNGQAPGIRRQYDHTYALLMQEMFGKGHKPGTMLAVMRTQEKGTEL